MKRLFAVTTAIFLLAPLFALAQTAPAVVKNIKTDFGAKCDGVSDDSTALMAFNTWALQWQQSNTGLIELDFPAATCVNNGGYGTAWPFKGVKKLRVVGYGTTLTGQSFFGGGAIKSGNGGWGYDDIWTARVNTVSSGNNTVTLKDPSRASIFHVGDWALLTGLDLMGYGYPPDPQFFEYVQITAINPTTGQITLSTPLKYSYNSTWPLYWAGNPGLQPDQGGPATLYAMDQTWDADIEYDGLTINQSGQVYGAGRSLTFKDVTFPDACEIPSQVQTWTLQNVNMSNCGIEVDKLVTTMNITGGAIHAIDFQSASIDTLNMNGTVINGFMNGTPKHTIMSNVNIASLGIGAHSYGASTDFSCTNCVLSAISPMSAGDSDVASKYTMTNGIITAPNSNGPLGWAVPGAYIAWRNYLAFHYPFQVVDVTQDAANTYVKTSMSAGFPAMWSPSGSYHPSLYVHPAIIFTCTNCSGSPEALSLSKAPAGVPLYSYSNHAYTGNFGSTPAFNQWGRLVSIKINVTKPYTGTKSSLSMEALGQFGAFVSNPDGSVTRIDPLINLKVAGERVITANGVTGVQAGDNISAPGAITFNGSLSAFLGANGTLADISSDDPSTWPSVTIEIVSDQGLGSVSPPPPPSSTPTATLTANPASITAGQSSTLSWSSTNATSCTGTGFSASGTSGSVSVTPSVTTTYSITCTGTGGSASASATVTVSVAPPPADTTPPSVPANLTATAVSQSQINLSWTASTDNVGVTGYKIYRGGVQVGTSVAPSYSDTGLSAATTYSYTVAAYDAAGNTSAQSSNASATTQSPTLQQPTVTLSANPTSITSGQSSTLTWSSTNATNCTGSGFSASGTSGSTSVSPTVTTTYSITCTGSGGSTSAAATITVSVAATLQIGARVQTTANLNVRNSPSNAKKNVVCTQPSGATGIIVGGPTVASGYTWWQINFDSGCDGWVVQNYLTPSSSLAPSTATLSIGSRVQTADNLNVRSSPSTGNNSKLLCTQPKGSNGTITQGPSTGSGYTWWNVNYDTLCDGWVVQDYLSASTALISPISQVASATVAAPSLTNIKMQLHAILQKLETLQQGKSNQ